MVSSRSLLVSTLVFTSTLALPGRAPASVTRRATHHHRDHDTAISDDYARHLITCSSSYNPIGTVTRDSPKANIKVGIIGAGISGLYSALLLESLGIEYEILEAQDRVGGRLFTHYFDKEEWDVSEHGEPEFYNYIDIGAMRYPRIDMMERVIGDAPWSLKNYLNSRLTAPRDQISLVPYYLGDDNNIHYFNRIRYLASQISDVTDPFNVSMSKGGPIPDDWAELYTGDLYDAVFTSIHNTSEVEGLSVAFEELQNYDDLNIRSYMRQVMDYPQSVINWLETKETGTNIYGSSILEEFLEYEIFTIAQNWSCIEGGSEMLSQGIYKILGKDHIKLNTTVRGIHATPLANDSAQMITVTDSTGMEHSYDHVINTLTHGVTRTLNLSGIEMPYGKSMALQSLTYDDSCKIAVKFNTRWWENNITDTMFGGVSHTDMKVRNVVYPSYADGIEDAPGVMILTYTWRQDASRMSGSIFPNGEYSDQNDELLDMLLAELAEIHGVSLDWIMEQYTGEYFSWSWGNNKYSLGAFPLYSEGQFSTYFPAIISPNQGMQLHWAGDGTSIHHGWVIGGLNSAWRSVAEILSGEERYAELEEFYEKWGKIEEVELSYYGFEEGPHPGYENPDPNNE